MTMTPEEKELTEKIKELIPPKGYEKLHAVFQLAIDQAAHGKGKERHASGEPFHEQPICYMTRQVGIGGPLYQAMKKTREAYRLFSMRPTAAKFEILGAMNYLAAAVIVLNEMVLTDNQSVPYCVSCGNSHYGLCYFDLKV